MPPKIKTKKKPDLQQPSLRSRALRLLGRREFSRQALDKRLRAYSETSEERASLLDDLAERGWLSDARYADALIRKRSGQFSRRAIAQELKQAGVSEDITAAALPVADPDEEFTAALALCQRKFRRASAPVEQKEKARQIRFLQSRGYSLSLALRVLKQASAEDKDSGE